MMPNKTQLTPDERIRAAYANLCCGVNQHTVAAMYGVNGGRVAEAITEVKKAVGWEDGAATREELKAVR